MSSSRSSNQQGQMKAFYRQRKKAETGSAKPKTPYLSSSSSTAKKSPSAAATLGSDVVQPPSLPHTDLHDGGYDEKEEEVLRQFDMNMAYGPCLGMSRLDRWERASHLGLNPPKEIRSLLDLSSTGARSRSLWDGRI